MTDRTTINVSKEAHRAASKAKSEEETWGEYLLRCADANPGTDLDTEKIVEEIKQDLSMMPEPGVDEEQLVQRINNRLDDLETELPRKVADELRK